MKVVKFASDITARREAMVGKIYFEGEEEDECDIEEPGEAATAVITATGTLGTERDAAAALDALFGLQEDVDDESL